MTPLMFETLARIGQGKAPGKSKKVGGALRIAQDRGWITWSPPDMRYLFTTQGRYAFEVAESTQGGVNR